MELLPEGQTNNTQVTFEDQQKINQFSTLISRKDLLSAELEEYKKEKDYLDDLSLEIELIDEDEKLNYKIGDTFVLLKQSDIVERLEKDVEVLDKKIEVLESQVEDLDDLLTSLKKLLYAKFGNAINLER
ncbi:unnamed protein product [Ambrosiozyma monospora]|uniref:Unnamed protein product n=1 Tax=Ambrosiozyma monospora TaxID=43982 RepID=A0ACB5SWH1_AMBMO|nr:unnamed protein product [Ambrosiozyma monospora]